VPPILNEHPPARHMSGIETGLRVDPHSSCGSSQTAASVLSGVKQHNQKHGDRLTS